MQISQNISLAPVTWLVITSSAEEDFPSFKIIVIPFNCFFIVATRKENDTFELTEVYQISEKREQVIQYLGILSRNGDLEIVEKDLYMRRKNLMGLRLSVILSYDGVYDPGK